MKKICFSERYGLHSAVLAGNKTQTRRIITRPMLDRIIKFQHEYFDATFDLLNGKDLLNQYFFVEQREAPPFNVGEIVAIAQRYKDIGINPDSIIQMPIKDSKTKGVMQCEASHSAGWTNKMFVKPDLMPHQICITNVRVQSLKDITDEECFKEGIDWWRCRNKVYYGFFDQEKKQFRGANKPREAYANLIDRLSDCGTWEANPKVFVYDFELVK